MKPGQVSAVSTRAIPTQPLTWRRLWFSACACSLLPWLMLHWAGVSYLAYRGDLQLHLLWLHQGQSYQHRFTPESGRFALSLGPRAGAKQRAGAAAKPSATSAPASSDTQLVWQGGHVELALFPLDRDQSLARLEQIRQNQRSWSFQLDPWHLLSAASLIIAALLWLKLWCHMPRGMSGR